MKKKLYLRGRYEGKTAIYFYDKDGRALGYQYEGNSQNPSKMDFTYTYTYDSNGNLTSRNIGNGLEKYTYDPDFKLIGYQKIDERNGLAGVEKSYAYDWVYFPENS